MKKILSCTIAFVIISLCSLSFAADEYSFDLQYTGDVITNEEKSANVLLVGVNGTLYNNVRIKVDIAGPSTPKIMATDSSGNNLDIAQIGYWGPDVGFPVQGSFTNNTPIKATFNTKGEYTIRLSLIDVNNSNIITTREFKINVIEPLTENNVIENNVIQNNISEIPKTGISVLEYSMYTIFIIVIAFVVYAMSKKRYK